ncbi:MAG: hypothetical protein NVSMB29_00500 [Candidatus Dormibacteria bacterium]
MRRPGVTTSSGTPQDREEPVSRVQHTEQIDAPVEAVFAFVDDYRNTTKYTKDLSRWQPVDAGKTHGKGAMFDLAMTAGPVKIESTVEMDRWTENREIGWHSIRGSKLGGSWNFKASRGGTEATLTLEYELPGGIAGRIMARGAEPVVRGNVQRSVQTLAHLLATQTPPPARKPPGGAKAKPPATASKRSTASKTTASTAKRTTRKGS